MSINTKGKEVFYRAEVIHYAPPLDEYDYPTGTPGRTEIYIEEWPVHHYTPKGVVLNCISGVRLKFVNNSHTKRWAWPSKAEALQSLNIRKRREIAILRTRIKENLKIVAAIERMQQLELTRTEVTYADRIKAEEWNREGKAQ